MHGELVNKALKNTENGYQRRDIEDRECVRDRGRKKDTVKVAEMS
jgi:hypothetical protein